LHVKRPASTSGNGRTQKVAEVQGRQTGSGGLAGEAVVPKETVRPPGEGYRGPGGVDDYAALQARTRSTCVVAGRGVEVASRAGVPAPSARVAMKHGSLNDTLPPTFVRIPEFPLSQLDVPSVLLRDTRS